MVKLAGGTPKIVHAGADTSFKLTAEQLKAAITPKTKLLILNSPSNPTGMVYTREELESIMAVAVEAGIWVMSDEIYEHLIYDGLEHVSPASISHEARAHTIIVSGLSKTYAMTGWRLGTLVAPESLAAACSRIAGQTTSNATTFAQWGALEAYRKPELAQDAIAQMCEAYVRRRRLLCEGLAAMDGVECLEPKGAFYAFPDISSFGLDSTVFAEGLLDQQSVAVVPGVAFGADSNVRMGYATSEAVIEGGLERFERYCRSL
jgi:aspartate aminotransferase